ncbi:MAG: hypothetical protein U0Q15_09955 [Kineosporiaceae bacterium]
MTPIRAVDVAGTARIVVLRDVTERRATEARLRDLLEQQTAVSRILGRCLRPADLPEVPGLTVAARALPAAGPHDAAPTLDDLPPDTVAGSSTTCTAPATAAGRSAWAR